MPTVLLECVQQGSKLKVKMRSPGFILGANCQFPRALRVAGRQFEVDAEAVKLMRAPSGTYFYSVKDRNKIRTLGEDGTVALPTRVYEDADSSECVVCMCGPKTTVFVPCGHFYTCHDCSRQLTTCPICRAVITNCIDKSLVDV